MAEIFRVDWYSFFMGILVGQVVVFVVYQFGQR